MGCAAGGAKVDKTNKGQLTSGSNAKGAKQRGLDDVEAETHEMLAWTAGEHGR